jgi:predicted nucleotidyltransferase
MGLDGTQIKLKLVESLQTETAFILLFGSVLTDQFSERSDVDVAIFLKDPNSFDLLDTITRLQDAIERKVDLVVLNDSDVIIAIQALMKGELIYCADQNQFLEFKSRKMSEYIDFKSFRAPIEASMKKGILKNG